MVRELASQVELLLLQESGLLPLGQLVHVNIGLILLLLELVNEIIVITFVVNVVIVIRMLIFIILENLAAVVEIPTFEFFSELSIIFPDLVCGDRVA